MGNEVNIQNKLFGKTFFWMFLGLLGSGIIAYYTYASELYYNIIQDGYFTVLLIVELVAVLLFSFLYRKLSPTAVGILYFVYSMLNGITLSVVFVAFELYSVIQLFVISAIVFAVLGIIGYKTNKDLSSWGPYLTVFIIAGLVLSIIDIFILKNPAFDLIIEWFILAVFSGETIYDVNRKKLLQSEPDINQEKIHIYCAMQLYLDFINIFLRILDIFGSRK